MNEYIMFGFEDEMEKIAELKDKDKDYIANIIGKGMLGAALGLAGRRAFRFANTGAKRSKRAIGRFVEDAAEHLPTGLGMFGAFSAAERDI